MTKFVLNEENISVFKNFAAINPQVIFKAGNSQRTCNESRNFIADIELHEAIPTDCCLFDLNRFLNIIDTTKGSEYPEIEFGDSSLTINHEHGSVTLPYAHPNVIAPPPPHTYTMATPFASFDLPAALWNKIRRTGASLQTTSLQFSIKSGVLAVKLVNDRDKGGEDIGWGLFNMPNTVVSPTAPDAVGVIKFGILEFLPGDYKAVIGNITSSANSGASIFGVNFTLNDPTKKVSYITSGHVIKKTA